MSQHDFNDWWDSPLNAHWLCVQDELRVGLSAPSAPSLPSFVTTERQTTSTGGHKFAGITHASQSHDNMQKMPQSGLSVGRPPPDQTNTSAAVEGHWMPLPFSDIGVDRKFPLARAYHDRKSVI